jgi:prolipoprotein diacylglyceryltransferase
MYGLLITIGIAVSVLIAEKQAKKTSLNTDILWEGTLVLLVCGLIGARIYHVADLWDFYKTNPEQIIQIWQGGMGIIGGIAGALIGTSLYLKHKNEKILEWLDLAAVFMPLGQSIGRWGNYFNKELLPYAFYESTLDFILFLTLFYINRTKKPAGYMTAAYLFGYALIRFILDDFHTHSWEIKGFSVARGVALGTIIVILILYVVHYIRPRRLQTQE